STWNRHPQGHTRLPGYARDRRGVIAEVHPACVYPDTNAEGRGESPEYLYTVAFDSRELWGEEAEAGATVYIDLFEPYLEVLE
ncbi:MAG: nitrile hydratase subunit beta, partial [Holophagales bacterium]|nr:nitrile hydratase subunit beta [Holophagales bacterium]